MNISDEAVEAAAKAIYATEAYPIYDEAKEEFTGHKPWEWLNERSWDSYRTKARTALEAAAPHLMADPARVEIALRELLADIDYDLHKQIERDEETGEDNYPKVSATFLRHYRSDGAGE
jgi:hypothetical protein